ncbi:iron-sulfur cluster assembly scaffold protein [Solimonas marina]|uniref:NIF system FeS cluster assembly NifU N-terminal domain-containing protein n=1 Tax=Solimonas marina TaxID=2714601 RepID=A0A969WEE1_9GAMM|nr:iron-sulfur cluster assembly scaffold protein [Solimonas marina]NKF24709.1 hypothetical protein [Solimonas marina]
MIAEPTVNVFGYPAPVWQRFRAPRHAGRLPADAIGVVEAQAGSAAARTMLRLQLAPGTGQARFQAYGCPVTIAVGEWLAEQIERRPFVEWSRIEASEIREVLEIPEDKLHCALMGEDSLRALAQQIPPSDVSKTS